MGWTSREKICTIPLCLQHSGGSHCPHLNVQARFVINEKANNELLQKYKDICEI